jgi:5'-phosphate synthase pdxT subunit
VHAVQGDFSDHQRVLEARGVATRQVRWPRDLIGIAGLVMPGGESTTMLKLLDLQGLTDPLRDYLSQDPPVLATCAGLILLAATVVEPEQRSFGVLDLVVARNGYGRQVHSGTFPLTVEGHGLPAEATGVFIRAPRILAVGAGVEVLARRDGDPVLVRKGRTLGVCFHPEMVEGHFVTDLFVGILRDGLVT